ncbi:LysE family transporter [Phyllobacterium sp. 628]|uniref:LysE family transporter n=1 Tax=Phyllobacterium sp. 628 TaxID=2718938 RepID=UPI0016627947|nr:LysE family transporter [Phyllobacterium sp. 628]QND53195.1 LysE family transporter [Phyllobacterium sp. 628]
MFLLTVAAIWTIAALTPGPNFFMVVRCTLTGSRKIAVSAVAGTLTGTLCWGLAGWLGVGSLFMAAPIAYMALKIAGGVYLLWLGLRLLWQVRRPRDEMAVPASKGRLTPMGAWRLGLATNLANPKSALFVASLFAATMAPGTLWTHGAAAVVVMVLISTIWYGGLVFALSHPSVAGAYKRARRTIDAFAGAIFVGFGLKLALSDR